MSLRLGLVFMLLGIRLPRFTSTIGLGAIVSPGAVLGGVNGSALVTPASSSSSRQGFDSTSRRVVSGMRGGAGGSSNPFTARMQVMITRNMRKVLVEELGYLVDEVEDMDPQIAAVVIEKSLPRPRAGMPIVWRKSIRQHEVPRNNPLTSFARALRGGMDATLQGVAIVAAFPFRMLGRAARATRRKATVTRVGVVGVVTLVAVVAGVAIPFQNNHSETQLFETSSSIGDSVMTKKGIKGSISLGALWPIRGARAEHIRSAETPISHRRPREGRGIDEEATGRRSWVGRRRTKMRSSALRRSGQGARTPDDTSSKTNPRMENKSPTVKERMKAQRGSRDRSSDSHRRHSPFEEKIGSSERSFRKISSELDDWTVQEADVGGDVDVDADMDMEELKTRGTGGMDEGDEGDVWYEAEDNIYPGASEARGFDDFPRGMTDDLEEEQGRSRWGRRPLSEHIPSEEELEAWESRLEPSDSWLDRGINRLFGERANEDRH